jgi:negative regulator of flagellin synthesis FlgM
MQINPTRTGLNQETGVTKHGDSSVGKTQASNRGLQDSVSVTSQAVQLRQLEESLSSIPDVDNARVQAIKQALADGSYTIDSQQLVDNLLRSEQDFV